MSLNLENATSLFIDCSNLACPDPVLRCRAACKSNPELKNLTVIVDNQAARENVTRFLNSQQYEVQVKLDGTKWIIQADRQIKPLAPSGQANKDNAAHPLPGLAENAGQGERTDQTNRTDQLERAEQMEREKPARGKNSRTVVLLTSEFIGQGDDTLGGKLMLNFLSTLPELGPELWRIIMLNAGVRLSSQDHPALPKLQALEASGVDILVCGTCLEFFGLMNKKRVGQTTNMLDVVTSLQLAAKVIRP